jgi:precorrin-6B methylase 2
MAFEEVMGLTNRLLTSAQALAALTARVRLDELGAEGDPAVREQLDRVVSALGVSEQIAKLDDGERAVVTAFARSYLAQALDLIEEPARAGAWGYDDPVLLQAQGSASAAVARLIASADLAADDARILDVGTGVGGLAIALCKTFPNATVVGIDPWEPALAIARENVVSAGFESRVTLQTTTVQELDDGDGFDLAWLPSFFIPEAVLEEALNRIFGALRPGGALVVGVLGGTADDPLISAVDDLFTVRSGGSAIAADDAIAHLRRAGFTNPYEVERTWDAPLRLVVGSRE